MSQAYRGTRPGGIAPEKALCGGFTLIEVITVIIIIGILSAFLLTRNASLSGELSARLSEVRSQLRYVQLLAMKSGTGLGMVCDGSTYHAFYAGNGSTGLLLPGETSQSVSLSQKSMAMGAFAISFDAAGIPYLVTGTAPSYTLTKLTGAASINITVNSTNGTLTVTPETGFVQ